MKILVVGGSGGIGAAAVRLLRAAGNDVFFTYHADQTKAAELEKATGAKKIPYDLSSGDSIVKLIQQITSEKFDGLIYAAAEKFERETLLKMPAKDLLEYIRKSIDGYYQVSQAFAWSVKNRKSSGSLVNILSSVVLGLPPAKQAGYVAAKYALLGLTKCQAVEFGPYNVRVNSVSPGMTKTKFNSDLSDRFLEIYAETLPAKRLLTPEEVARTVCFLLSPEASDMQGNNLTVEGGSSC